VHYDAINHLLTATGMTQNASIPPSVNLNLGQFSVSIPVDNTGHLMAGASSLSLTGDLGGGPVLLFASSEATAFGFSTNGTIEFVFRESGGALGSVGGGIGTIMATNAGAPDFVNGFDTYFQGLPFGLGNADTFVTSIPAPGAAALAGLGLLAAGRRRRA
jgi:uncharacterized protein (TIGR03382 family)